LFDTVWTSKENKEEVIFSPVSVCPLAESHNSPNETDTHKLLQLCYKCNTNNCTIIEADKFLSSSATVKWFYILNPSKGRRVNWLHLAIQV